MESKQNDARTVQSASWSEYLERISEIERTGIMYVSAEDYEFLCDMIDADDDENEKIGE